MGLPSRSCIDVEQLPGSDVYAIRVQAQWVSTLNRWQTPLRDSIDADLRHAEVSLVTPPEGDARGKWFTFIKVDVTGCRVRLDERKLRRMVLDWLRTADAAPHGLASATAMG